ncbi:MAG: DUF222 domain-containing protein, partial [Mycobacterium sp.]
MFNSEFIDAADSVVVAAIEDGARAEAAAAARRLAATAELAHRRVGDRDERAKWACDPWDSAAAEVAAAMNISHRKASGQMRIAQTLRDHLPAVAELYRRGELSTRVVCAITWRTRLITDDAVWALIDTELSQLAIQWGPLSEDKLTAAVDALVLKFDKSAVIESCAEARTRDFTVGDVDDEAGVASVWGKLLAADAAVLNKKVAAMAATVCDADPRSLKERRADALGALANGNHHLPCACESPACPARQAQPAPKSSVVINVVADQAAIDTAQAASAGTAIFFGRRGYPDPVVGRAAAQRRQTTTAMRTRRGRTRTYVPSVGETDALCPGPGSDMPVSRVHDARG